LNPAVAAPAGHLATFDQSEFSGSSSLGAEGFIYVPGMCRDGTTACKLHVAFHGCSQNKDAVGDQYARRSGYNPWAEANGIIVLYPQTSLSAVNQCWDWWGYGELGPDKRYHTREGAQMAAVKAMVDRIAGLPGPDLYCGTDSNSGHLSANRAYRLFFFFYFASGSGDYLGLSGSAGTTLQETSPGNFKKRASCP
jgi:Esterase PHB depolymerase